MIVIEHTYACLQVFSVLSDHQATAFAGDMQADAEWITQYDKEMDNKKELRQELSG